MSYINAAFEMTEDHLKLVRALYINFQEEPYLGAPFVDLKRPYGNSDILRDICEILGYDEEECEENDDDEDRQDKLIQLHRETTVALQIILITGSFEPGWYVGHFPNFHWRKITKDDDLDAIILEMRDIVSYFPHDGILAGWLKYR